ncbi:CubicO group peptidase, beta-lactamase class C family [Asanoa hainanensis]|uniref:CubicO group peptidase, beta-lactamase class C family n=1 Tax=Asanoa hainanensis TaxID=560556 RepID=A0A239PC83_9ACTN|nr:serine hydrolase domain-containing protein [Asanoa hainanensis]SNT64562.1 CubicO group peptidase, beta-lactamase class C family [Asanoa hainanensis]
MLEIENFSGVIVVARDGQPPAIRTTGPWTPDTPFQIASVSKNFAATLALMLVEDGLLDLHEPVTRWLPEAQEGISLHHLLSNTSGIGHWQDVPGMDPETPATRDERLALVVRAPLLSEPGTEFRYSSPAFLLASVVAERAAGRPYTELLSEKVIEPLGLTATGSGVAPVGVAPGHHAGTPVEPWDLRSMIGSGDLFSTATDLVAYAHALHDGNLVSPASLALMRTRHIAFPEPERTPDGRHSIAGYGYGHYVGTFDGRPAVLHTGDNPGYKSLLGWFPDGVVVVALSNDDAVQWEDVLPHLLS